MKHISLTHSETKLLRAALIREIEELAPFCDEPNNLFHLALMQRLQLLLRFGPVLLKFDKPS